MAARFAAANVSMAFICVDPPDVSKTKMAGLIGGRIRLLSDPDLKVAMAYGVAMVGRDIAVPATFVVAPDRSIAFTYVGESMSDRPSNTYLLKMASELKR